MTSIKEFALPIIIGLISGTYSSIFIATPIWIGHGGRPGEKRAQKNGAGAAEGQSITALPV